MDTAFMGLTSSRDVTASGTLPARIPSRPTIFLSATRIDQESHHRRPARYEKYQRKADAEYPVVRLGSRP
ncbi:hypothetical protein [Nocardia sp. NPDC049526]|uniref:hypothetical protein n=1 Tax=Nocardia sp. NPDC049526 TaxID=3364316 RepID=UPI0037B5D658